MCKCENGELAKCAGDNNSKTMCAILGHLSAEAAVATRTYAVISQLVNRLGHLIRLEYNKKWRMQTGAASRSDEYPQQITIIYARSHSASSGTGWKGHDGAQDVRQEPEERNGGVYEYECGSVRRYWVSSSHVKCIFYRTLLNLLSAVRLHSMPSSRSGSPSHGHIDIDPRQRVGRQTGSWKASSHVDGSWFAVRLMGHISHFLRFRLFNGHGVSWRRSPLSVHCPMPIPVYGYWFLL